MGLSSQEVFLRLHPSRTQAALTQGMASWHLAGDGDCAVGQPQTRRYQSIDAGSERGHHDCSLLSTIGEPNHHWYRCRIDPDILPCPRARANVDHFPTEAAYIGPHSSTDEACRKPIREDIADTLRAGVVALESRDELRGLAAGLLHHAHAGLRQDGRLARRERRFDQPDAFSSNTWVLVLSLMATT